MAIYKDAEKLKKELFERKDAANKCYAAASAKCDVEMMVRADAVVGAFIECILTINSLPPADVVDKELYDRLLKNSIIISEALNKYQTADMVEVVRCKNCKYHDDEKPGMVYCYCPDLVCGWVSEDFFCGNGRKERK